MATQSDTVLAVQRSVKALERVSQNLDVFFAELEERAHNCAENDSNAERFGG